MDETNNDLAGTQQRMTTENNRNINEALTNNRPSFKLNMGNQEQANTDIGEMLRSANKVTINKCKKKFKEKEKYLAKLQKSKEDTNPKKQQVKGNKKNKLKQNQTGGNNTTKLPPIEHDYATPQHTQTELTSAQKNQAEAYYPTETDPRIQIPLDDNTSGEDTERYEEEERIEEGRTPQPSNKTDSESSPPTHDRPKNRPTLNTGKRRAALHPRGKRGRQMTAHQLNYETQNTATENIPTENNTNPPNTPTNTANTDTQNTTQEDTIETTTTQEHTNDNNTNENINHKNSTTATHQNSQYKPTPIIIDNIKTTLNKTQIDRTLKDTFKDIKFSIQHLKKGGVVLTPELSPRIQEHTCSMLKKEKYQKEIFGNSLYIHLAGKKDVRPWLCINKIPPQISLQEIEAELKKLNIETEGLHRKQNGSLISTIILFKVNNERIEKQITHTKITIGNTTTNIRKYINANTLRCTNCQQLGHLNRGCKNIRRCVRCAATTCPPGACLNGTLRRCVNCKEAHSSAYKNCKAQKTNNKNNMDKMIQKQAEHTILNRHHTLQAQQTQCNKEIKEHQQNTTTLTKNYEELKTEITQIKQTYAEITTNSVPPQQNTQKINENTNMENMAQELTALKALVDTLHDNDLNNTVTITNLQKENKQLQQKIDKLQQQQNRKPIPHVEDATNLQQNINDTCITILKLITIPLITQTFIHKQTINNSLAHYFCFLATLACVVCVCDLTNSRW